MKGLELALRFFDEWGLPYLLANHPELTQHLAAGVLGRSQSVGLDDEISHDHGWGPGFLIWLMHEDYEKLGAAFAADTEFQNQGIAQLMYHEVFSRLRGDGIEYVKVCTGGDPSHAPARTAYEKVGFDIALPGAEYFRRL